MQGPSLPQSSSRDLRTSIGSLIHQNGDTQNHHLPARPSVDLFHHWGRTFYKVDDRVVYTAAIDEGEQLRLDGLHHLIHSIALNERWCTKDFPSSRHRRRALDVGCGTGVWCLDFADRNPHFDIIGIDLYCEIAAREPQVAPNARIITPVDFISSHWPFRTGEFDLIRNAGLNGCVPNWTQHFQKCHRYLKSGGVVEYIDFDWTIEPLLGHSTPPHFNCVLHWWNLMQQAAQQVNKPFPRPSEIDGMLRAAGFANTNHTTITLPLSRPKDPGQSMHCYEGRLESYVKAMMFEQTNNLAAQLEGMSLYPLCIILRMPEAQARDLLRQVADVCWPSSRMCFSLHVVSASKP